MRCVPHSCRAAIWFRVSAGLGAVGVRLAAGLRRRRRPQPAAQAVVHPPVDERRAGHHRPVRPEARPRQRRAVQADRGGPRPPDRRAPAAAGQARQAPGRRPLDVHQGRRPRSGHLLPMRTGNLPQGAIQFPTLGSLVSKELGDPSAELPNFVSRLAVPAVRQGAFGPGFLGPNYAPLIVGEGNFAAAAAGRERRPYAPRAGPGPAAGRHAGTGRVAVRPAQGPGARRSSPTGRRSWPRATRPPTTGPCG